MNPYLLPAVGLSPAAIRRLIQALPPDQLDRAIDKDRFTPREVVAHLADWEPILRERIASALRSPGAAIALYDEEQMAVDHRYSESDVAAQCDLFAKERAATEELMRGISAEGWKQIVLHPERGELTAEDIANMLLGHDLYHLEQLSASLAAAP